LVLLVKITKVVLVEVAGGVAERFERWRNSDIAILKAYGRGGCANLRETGAFGQIERGHPLQKRF
jgi:hypothetical protein